MAYLLFSWLYPLIAFSYRIEIVSMSVSHWVVCSSKRRIASCLPLPSYPVSRHTLKLYACVTYLCIVSLHPPTTLKSGLLVVRTLVEETQIQNGYKIVYDG